MKNLDILMNDYNYTKKTIAKEIGATEVAVDNWNKGRNGIGELNKVKLGNLLERVSKNRSGKKSGRVLIPEYVAKTIENAKKEGGTWLLSFNTFVWRARKQGDVNATRTFEWMNNHKKTSEVNRANEKVAMAWMSGYETLKQEYVVIISEQFVENSGWAGVWSCYVEHSTLKENGKFFQYKGVDNCYFNPTKTKEPNFTKESHTLTKNAVAQELKYRFTEAEIKEIDERYWAFAVPVEELEE